MRYIYRKIDAKKFTLTNKWANPPFGSHKQSVTDHSLIYWPSALVSLWVNYLVLVLLNFNPLPFLFFLLSQNTQKTPYTKFCQLSLRYSLFSFVFQEYDQTVQFDSQWHENGQLVHSVQLFTLSTNTHYYLFIFCHKWQRTFVQVRG